MTALSSSKGRLIKRYLSRPGGLCLYKGALVLAFLIVKLLVSAPVVEASENSGFQPSYYRQLQHYALEMERQKQEEALADSYLEYNVKPGDTLSSVAEKHDIRVEDLLCWNDLSNPHLIHPGQKLTLLKVEGALHEVKEGETLHQIADRYNVSVCDIEDFNLLDSENSLYEGKKLVIPGGEMPKSEIRAASNLLLASRTSRSGFSGAGSGGAVEVTTDLLQKAPAFVWPVKGEITSPFGPRSGSFHFGLDIAAPYGSIIRAAARGEVEFTGWLGGYGLTLILDHGEGWSTLYAHNSDLLVQGGQTVAQGEDVARAGSSGNASGPHLHFEIIYDERKLDPLPFLER